MAAGRDPEGAPPQRWAAARAGLALSIPAALALAAAWAAGAVAPGVAAAVWLASAAGAALLARRHYAALAAVGRFLAARAGPDAPPPPAPDARRLAELSDGGGEVGALAGAAIQGDRRWERRLDESGAAAEGAARLVESLPGPLLLVDRAERITLANAAAREAFGARVSGGGLQTAIRDPGLNAAARAALAGEGGREVEIVGPEPPGRVYVARVAPVAGPDGTACLVAFSDITEARRAENMRSEFVANVSHELRTPLTTLHGFVETLRGPARDDAEARGRFLEVMAGQTERMTRLVSDLLSLSRIEAREHHPPTDRVDIAGVLSRAAAAAGVEARRKGMRIALDLADGLPPVAGDADDLAQVAQNLIDNAVKYGRDGTEARVEARLDGAPPASWPGPPGPAVAIAVADRGEGIEREHIPRLTERFYRVDTARSRALGGTGLGLAIVKHIVARHRGALHIASEAGRGSVFTVYLPPAPPAPGGEDGGGHGNGGDGGASENFSQP